jgi:hypothetical protein
MQAELASTALAVGPDETEKRLGKSKHSRSLTSEYEEVGPMQLSP